jgi:hypothetical protein
MKRLVILSALVAVLALAGPARGQPTLYVSPDVPTDPDGPLTFLPWEIVRHEHLSAAPFALEMGIPGNPALDALQKMDTPGDWLFSVEAPNDLGGSLPNPAMPRDVVRLDAGGTFSLFFDGSCVVGAVPISSNIDALYLEAGDAGPLVVSFDVPTTIAGATVLPSELVRYLPAGAPPCGWQIAGSVIDFATLGNYFPGSTNVTGADFVAGEWILSFDIPVDVAPPAGPTRTPGQLVSTDGVVWNHFHDDLQTEGAPGWPISSLVDALSCQANPGRIDPAVSQIRLDKNLPQIEIFCGGSCSSGGEVYGLYEGTIANVGAGVHDHVAVGGACAETCPGSIFRVPPAATSTYYLVVPNNYKEEGSYGIASSGAERPQPAPPDRCVVPQNLTPCPP